MELNDKDIEQIELYLQGKLSGNELLAFESRLRDDADFAAEVDTWRNIFGSIQLQGKSHLKTQLASIEASLITGGEIEDYQPDPPPGSDGKSGGIGGGTIFFVTILIAGAFGSWFYLNNPDRAEHIMQDWTDTILQEKVIVPKEQPPADTVIKKTRTIIRKSVVLEGDSASIKAQLDSLKESTSNMRVEFQIDTVEVDEE